MKNKSKQDTYKFTFTVQFMEPVDPKEAWRIARKAINNHNARVLAVKLEHGDDN